MPGGSDRPLGSVPPSEGEALGRIVAAGGEALTQKMPIPGVGYTAYCRDTEGNTFGVYEDDPSAT